MLPKYARLKSPRLFQQTLDRNVGKRLCSNPLFSVLALPQPASGQYPLRFGLIISKKVHKRANRRNKIKRRLREIIRKDIIQADSPSAKLSPFQCLVIIVRSASLDASYETLRQALLTCVCEDSK